MTKACPSQKRFYNYFSLLCTIIALNGCAGKGVTSDPREPSDRGPSSEKKSESETVNLMDMPVESLGDLLASQLSLNAKKKNATLPEESPSEIIIGRPSEFFSRSLDDLLQAQESRDQAVKDLKKVVNRRNRLNSQETEKAAAAIERVSLADAKLRQGFEKQFLKHPEVKFIGLSKKILKIEHATLRKGILLVSSGLALFEPFGKRQMSRADAIKSCEENGAMLPDEEDVTLLFQYYIDAMYSDSDVNYVFKPKLLGMGVSWLRDGKLGHLRTGHVEGELNIQSKFWAHCVVRYW